VLGINHYEPTIYTESEDIIKEIGPRLKELIGKRILEVWIVWENIANEWFKDCPVVLKIENAYLELCTSKLSDFAISWNTIDMSIKPEWYGTFDLEWRKSNMLELSSVVNNTINDIQILEYNFKLDKSSVWLLNGIAFKFDEGYFSIYNGLDTNEISLKSEIGKDDRLISIA
jgi:hypothetical protein